MFFNCKKTCLFKGTFFFLNWLILNVLEPFFILILSFLLFLVIMFFFLVRRIDELWAVLFFCFLATLCVDCLMRLILVVFLLICLFVIVLFLLFDLKFLNYFLKLSCLISQKQTWPWFSSWKNIRKRFFRIQNMFFSFFTTNRWFWCLGTVSNYLANFFEVKLIHKWALVFLSGYYVLPIIGMLWVIYRLWIFLSLIILKNKPTLSDFTWLDAINVIIIDKVFFILLEGRTNFRNTISYNI